MDAPVNVPVDDPNADTEWNDILRKHGIIPEKPPSPTPVIEEALLEAKRLAHENRLEAKDIDELAELEDEENEDFLAHYRHKRLAELSKISVASIHNQVYHLQKPDYAQDVTEASMKNFVFVLLTSSHSNVESRLLIEMWRALAAKFGDVKFCQIQADMCIEGYPERNTPTILIYRDGGIKRQLITLREMRGIETTIEDLERLLVEVGAIGQTDPRIKSGMAEDGFSTGKSRRSQRSQAKDDEDDSDWE